MNSFTYTISSISNIVNGVGVDNNANEVNVKFILPPKYKYFKCKIKNFVINPVTITGDTDFLYLVSTNFSCDGVLNSSNTNTQYIAFCDTASGINNNVDNNFYVENVNGKVITFNLRDDSADDVAFARINTTRDTVWFLTMEFTPIDEIPEEKNIQRLQIGKYNNF